jgi:hypothetical protein
MNTEKTFPMTLRELADELDNIGIELMVHRSSVEYDVHQIGFDVYATLECRAQDRRPDEDQSEDAYERAMDILGNL